MLREVSEVRRSVGKFPGPARNARPRFSHGGPEGHGAALAARAHRKSLLARTAYAPRMPSPLQLLVVAVIAAACALAVAGVLHLVGLGAHAPVAAAVSAAVSASTSILSISRRGRCEASQPAETP